MAQPLRDHSAEYGANALTELLSKTKSGKRLLLPGRLLSLIPPHVQNRVQPQTADRVSIPLPRPLNIRCTCYSMDSCLQGIWELDMQNQTKLDTSRLLGFRLAATAGTHSALTGAKIGKPLPPKGPINLLALMGPKIGEISGGGG